MSHSYTLLQPAKNSFWKEACTKVYPLILVCLAGLIFSFLAMLSKLMPISAGQYVITESAFNIPFCLLICYHNGVDVSLWSIKSKKSWFLVRVIIGGTVSGLKILVIKNMNIGDATAILFTSPIWVALLARIILKEKFTVINLIALIFGFLGIILITKPAFLFHEVSSRESSVFWSLIALLCSILRAISYVCVRGAGKDVHPMQFVLYTAVSELIHGFLINIAMKQTLVLPPCGWIRYALFLCGVGATLANLFMVRGLSLENAGPATTMRNWDTVYAYGFQVIIFNNTPDLICMSGACLIVSMSVLQGLDKLFDFSCGITF